MIDDRFPGGNIVVDDIAADTVRIHQDLRDTERDWFYWYFRVRGVRARALRFEFTRSRALGARGPAVSRDGGHSWSWLGTEAVDGNAFTYPFCDAAQEMRFSFGMPYQADRWRRFMAGLEGHPSLRRDALCTTPAGRQVERVVVGSAEAPAHRVAITCRHHCCEMMASYTLEGLVEWLVADAAADAAWLRAHAQVAVVAFVDLDGVEAGDQGKGRRPRDHGRDYDGTSVHATTAAIRRWLPDFGAGRLHVCLDLHCPWIAGPGNEVVYLVGSADPEIAAQQLRFTSLLARHATALPVAVDDFLPFGTSWNTDANHTEGLGFSGWTATLPGVRLATGVEIPYATAGHAEVNQTSARRFGRDLGVALAAYLREDGA